MFSITDCNTSDLNLTELMIKNGNDSWPHYKTGSNPEVMCREGLTTSESFDSFVIDYVIVTCQDGWKPDDIKCWKGKYCLFLLFSKKVKNHWSIQTHESLYNIISVLCYLISVTFQENTLMCSLNFFDTSSDSEQRNINFLQNILRKNIAQISRKTPWISGI